MKTTRKLFGIFTITAALAMSVHAQTFLTNGLVAYYPFNGNGNDASGNGHDGTVAGATLTTNRFGQANSAYAFDGMSSLIVVSNSSDLQPFGDFSVSVWVQAQNYGVMLCKHRDGANNSGWFMSVEPPAFGGLPLQFQAAPLFDPLAPQADIPFGTWFQAVFTYQRSSGTCNMYINGQLVDSRVRDYNTNNDPDPFTIGAQSAYQTSSGYDYYFAGSLDDIRIYNRALQTNEVSQLYQYESTLQAPPVKLLDINFGGYDTNKVGFAAIGQTANDYWNGYVFGLQIYGAVSDLKWADRSGSGINLTVLNAPGGWGNTTGDGMYDHYIYPWDGGNITTTLTNVPAGSYDFYLYGHSPNAWENSKFQITVGTNTTAWKQTQDSTLAGTSTNWAEGVQYVVFRNVTVSSGQAVVITCAPGDAGAAVFNGLQMISSGVQQTPPVIASFAPASGMVGTNVTLTGLNFSPVASNNIVYFGAVRAVVTAASPTNLTATVPMGATYAPITETVNGLTAYADQPFLPTFSGNGQIDSSSLGSRIDLPTGNNPERVVITDLEGDGRPDLVIADSSSGDISIYQNISSNGVLEFAPRVVLPDIPGNLCNPYTVAVADLDGDGKPDIIAVNADSYVVSIFRNISTPGILTTNSFAPRQDFPGGNAMRDIAIQDLSRDGKPDLVTADQDDNAISVFQNQSTIGNISFAPRVDFAAGNGPNGVAIADLDGDGEPDIASANSAAGVGTVSVFRNLGSGRTITTNSFAPPVSFTTGATPIHLAIGDLDGDGRLDIVTANGSQGLSISVLRNLTSGPGIAANSFAPHVDFPLPGWGYNPALGDLDGDGKPDLAVVGQISSFLSLFHNASTAGSFTTGSLGSRVDFSSGYNTVGVSVGDLNDDGKPDVVFGNQYDNTISIYLNNVPSPTPPTITSDPQDAYVDAYGTASFSVTATGASSYQWWFNGSNLLNATASTLTLSNIEQSDLGAYSVVAANSYGAVTSSVANLYMYPSIVTPFTGLVTDWGQSTTLSVGAWGSGMLTYQWYDNGVAILNATNSTYTFSAIQFTNAGLYSVVVSSSLGSVTNTAAQVVVNAAGTSLGLYPGITVTGTVGYTYDIQSNPDLTNPNGWTTVATLTLWQPVEFWVDVNNNAASPTNQHRFYRVLPAQ